MKRNDSGAPPSTGFAVFKPELLVTDLEASLFFWVDVLGFQIAYQRTKELFVYLETENGAQVMLCQRNGKWETGPMNRPLGRGVMFQMETSNLDAIELRSLECEWPIHTGPREVWRKLGDRMGGQREIFVQDPDGYLLMLERSLGMLELTEASS